MATLRAYLEIEIIRLQYAVFLFLVIHESRNLFGSTIAKVLAYLS